MDTKKFIVCKKEVTLFPAGQTDRPLIVLNTFTGDGSSVMKEIRKLSSKDFSLLAVGGLKWYHDMTPWECAPVSENDTPFTGGAYEYLDLLISEILPKAREIVGDTPHTGIAGYSLAGLFAIYALYNCDVFDRAASMSGSLWFPNFKEYVLGHDLPCKPDKLYISLGDKEAGAKQPLLKTVQDNTEAIVEHYRQLSLSVAFEMNKGGHFYNADIRSAKGIAAII